MNKRSLVTLVMCGTTLVLMGCVPKEIARFSRRQANWLTADEGAADLASEVDEPGILPRTHFAAGQLFEQQGEVRKAIIQYRKAIADGPDYVPAYNRLGVLLGRLGRHKEAEYALGKAVEFRPDWAFLRNNLGFEYMLQERWNDAEAELRNALRLKPDFARAHNNLAMVLFKTGRIEESLTQFLQAVPEADAYYNLGLMFRGHHRYRDAANAFEHVLSLSPQFEAAKTQLAQIAPNLEMETVLEPTTDMEEWETVAQTDAIEEQTDETVEEISLASAEDLRGNPIPQESPVEEESPSDPDAERVAGDSAGLDDVPGTPDGQIAVAQSQDGDRLALDDEVAAKWKAPEAQIQPMELTGGWKSEEDAAPVYDGPEALLDQVVCLFPDHPLEGFRTPAGNIEHAKPTPGPALREFGELFDENNPHLMPPFNDPTTMCGDAPI